MSLQKNWGTFFSSLGLIAAFFTVLLLGPSLLQTKTFRVSFNSWDAESSLREFPLKTPFSVINGKKAKIQSLNDLFGSHGQLLLINFWATWCPPCVDELPSLEYLSRELAVSKKDFLPQLITIAVDDDFLTVKRFIANSGHKTSLTVLHDPNGNFARSVGTIKFPETYLVNKQGKILYKWVGPENWLSQNVIDKFIKPPTFR